MPFKIIGSIGVIAAFLGVVYTVDSRWVRCPVYAAETSVIQKRLDAIDRKSLETSIEDLKDRLDNSKLSAERRGELKERVRSKQKELKAIDNLMVVPQ